ncbi:MAG: hypothetical protein R3C53_21795 [Pirellulaceae bacterium]
MNRRGMPGRLMDRRVVLVVILLMPLGCSRSKEPRADGAQQVPMATDDEQLPAMALAVQPQETLDDLPPSLGAEENAAASAEVESPALVDDFSLYDSAPILGASANTAQVPEAAAESEQCVVLPVPFSVTGCVPTSTKDICVAWGFEFDDVPGEHPIRPPFPDTTRLAVFDLATQKVLRERVIDATLTQLVCNATGIYAAGPASREPITMRESITILRFSNENLESLGSIEVKPGRIVSVGDQFLAVTTDHFRDQVKIALPELVEIKQDLGAMPPIGLETTLHVRQLSEGWMFEGILWSHDLKTPRLIVFAKSVTPAEPTLNTRRSIVTVPIFAGFWTHARDGRTPFETNHITDRPRYSPHIPAELNFSSTLYQERDLNFLDFATKETLYKIRLPDEFTGGSAPSSIGLAASPDWMLLSLKGKAVAISLDSPRIPKKKPFRIEPVQSTFVLDSEEPTAVSYRSDSATRFELEIPAFQVDGRPLMLQSSTGEFIIDVPKYLPNLVKAKTASYSPSYDTSHWLPQQVAAGSKTFSKLTGRKPSGLPLAVNCAVRAFSEDLSVAVLEHIYLLDVPTSDFQQSQGEQVAAIRAEQAARARIREELTNNKPAATARPSRSSPISPPEATEDKVEKIPNRTWTDRQGRQVLATLKSFNGAVAQIVDSRGQTLLVPIERLDDVDQVWLKEHAANSP